VSPKRHARLASDLIEVQEADCAIGASLRTSAPENDRLGRLLATCSTRGGTGFEPPRWSAVRRLMREALEPVTFQFITH
jgi:hypothetical protein